jgi:protease I
MGSELNGRRVAILVTDGFEQVEMTRPREALQQAGATTELISPEGKEVQGMNHSDKGDKFRPEKPLASARAADYDALLLPGGVANPDRLRMLPEAVHFVEQFFRSEKPVAAICHGPWLLVEAGAVKGRTVTSWPSLKTDIKNAGGNWVDREVVVDRGLVTSRKPDDITAFNRKMIEEFAEGVHAGTRAGSKRERA